MKLDEILNTVFTESAAGGAISAHSIAGTRGSMFGGGAVNTNVIRRQTKPKYKAVRLKIARDPDDPIIKPIEMK